MRITWQGLKHPKTRKQLIRYWVADPIFGGIGFGIHYFLRYSPLWLNSWLGRNLGKLAFKFYLKKEAARAKHNLTILCPNLSESERNSVLDRMWENIGQTMSEYSILDKLWDKGRVQVDDSDAIEYLSSGKPAIFTGAHLGNWEAQASYVHAKQIPLMAMYKPVRNRFMRKLSAIGRSRMNILTVPTDAQAMRRMYQHLANNGVVWLPIDDFKDGQVHFPRFGRPLVQKGINATHIVRLAKRFNAAVIPVHITRVNQPAPSFHVKVHTPLFVQDGSEQAEQHLLTTLDKMVESWVLSKPDQWFMLHDLRL